MDFVVVSGSTGSGKSTMADALGTALGATVVSFDWVMSALRSFPDLWAVVERPAEHQREVGWTLLSRVAEQQLRRGASVVVDLVARQLVVARWAALAESYGARFAVVECVCGDPDLQRARVESRHRDIPGWYELTWTQIERSRTGYVPLDGPKLVVDSVDPLADNLRAARLHLGDPPRR